MVTSCDVTTNHQQHFVILDGVRGIAAIAVALAHCSMFSPLIICASGGNAVDLFFCLSGFVLAYAYGERVSGGMKFGTFMKFRFCRLYPMYCIGLMLGIAVLVYLYSHNHTNFSYRQIEEAGMLNLVYVPLFLQHNATVGPIEFYGAYTINPPFWSLFYEILLSAIFFFVAGWKQNYRKVLTIYAGMFMVMFSSGVAGGLQTTFWYGLPRALYPFLIGMLLYRHKDQLQRRFSGCPLWAVFLLATLPFFFDSSSKLVMYGVQTLYVLIICPLIIATGIAVNTQNNDRLLKTASYLGRLSYPLYCVHFPVLYLFIGIFGTVGLPISAANMLAAFTVSMLIANIMVFYVELPARALLMRWLGLNPNKIARS